MDQTYRFLLICFIMSVHVVLSQSCVYQECSCSDTSIDCEGRGLTTMPTLIPSTVQYTSVNLDTNAITEIPAGSLPSNLTSIYLDGNPTTIIADEAFDDSASTLATLSFTMAMFARIPDFLHYLKALTYFRIVNTTIQDWNDGAMVNIGRTISTLDIENVGLTTWPKWMYNFTRLTELTISSSFISAIPDDAFDHVINTLTTLTLQNNSLTTVPKALSNCTVLQNLYMENNKIVDITWLPRDSRLTTLSLANNLISDANHLSNAIERFQDSLQDLIISNNRLSAIPNLIYLKNVTSLDFTSNRLSDPNSGSVSPSIQFIDFTLNVLPSVPRVLKTLQSVLILNLPSNAITHIEASDFLSSTAEVYLENNLITQLNDNSFPVNSSITGLQLSNNPISAISDLAFHNLQHLSSLNLQGTRLTRLPLALNTLSSLYILDMTNNANLKCTCLEKSLRQFMMKIPTGNVLGNCGIISIFEFYEKLSPLCP